MANMFIGFSPFHLRDDRPKEIEKISEEPGWGVFPGGFPPDLDSTISGEHCQVQPWETPELQVGKDAIPKNSRLSLRDRIDGRPSSHLPRHSIVDIIPYPILRIHKRILRVFLFFYEGTLCISLQYFHWQRVC